MAALEVYTEEMQNVLQCLQLFSRHAPVPPLSLLLLLLSKLPQ